MDIDEIIKVLKKIKEENKEESMPVCVYDVGVGQNKQINNIYIEDGKVEIWID